MDDIVDTVNYNFMWTPHVILCIFFFFLVVLIFFLELLGRLAARTHGCWVRACPRRPWRLAVAVGARSTSHGGLLRITIIAWPPELTPLPVGGAGAAAGARTAAHRGAGAALPVGELLV